MLLSNKRRPNGGKKETTNNLTRNPHNSKKIRQKKRKRKRLPAQRPAAFPLGLDRPSNNRASIPAASPHEWTGNPPLPPASGSGTRALPHAARAALHTEYVCASCGVKMEGTNRRATSLKQPTGVLSLSPSCPNRSAGVLAKTHDNSGKRGQCPRARKIPIKRRPRSALPNATSHTRPLPCPDLTPRRQ